MRMGSRRFAGRRVAEVGRSPLGPQCPTTLDSPASHPPSHSLNSCQTFMHTPDIDTLRAGERAWDVWRTWAPGTYGRPGVDIGDTIAECSDRHLSGYGRHTWAHWDR